MNLRSLHNFLLVKRLECDGQTASGVLVANAVAEEPDRGEVIAASAVTRIRDESLRPPDVAVGNKLPP